MIKRIGKRKNSKQGAILVIVVLILALAMIFIASAMMLTKATRTRLYDNTMQSQARLTVTAASEVFLEALETQEITDAQIDTLLSNTPSRHTSNSDKIKMVVANMPGMSDSAAGDNNTYLDIYYPDSKNKDIVYADFTTVIGDEVENVRLILNVKNSEPSYGGNFKNQIDIGGNVTTSQVRFSRGVGMVNPALGDVNDNTILFRGNSYEQTSDAIFYSDIVYADGAYSKFGGGNYYYGNMIFLQNAYLSGTASVKKIAGDFYFIGSSQNDAGIVYENDNIWSSISSDSVFVFSGRTAQDKDQDNASDQNSKVKGVLQNRTCYFVGNEDSEIICTNGNQNDSYKGTKYTYAINNAYAANGNSLPSEYSNKLNTYEAYDYTKANDPFPSSLTEVFVSMNPDGNTKVIPANTELDRDEYSIDGTTVYPKGSKQATDIEVVMNPLTTSYPEWKKGEDGKIPADRVINVSDLADMADANQVIALDPGYYQFTSGTFEPSTDDPYVIAINGANAGSYRFFFEAGTYQISNCVFAVYNVQSSPKPVVFILEDGAQLHFSGANFRKTNCLCSCGFISVNRGFTSAAALAKYIKDTSSTGEDIVWDEKYKDKDDKSISYSKYYDGIAKPSIYVLGYGSDGSTTDFRVGDSCTLEAYIGLYGPGAQFSQRNDIASRISIYGRIEASTFANGDNPTGDFQMPYCPAPGNADDQPDCRRAETKYKVSDIIYYYE